MICGRVKYEPKGLSLGSRKNNETTNGNRKWVHGLTATATNDAYM